MKRLIAIIFCLSVVASGFAQDKEPFFQRLKNLFVVHDTVYIYADSLAHDMDTLSVMEDLDDIEGEDEEGEDEEEGDGLSEKSGGIPTPIDTIDTEDKFCKVVLFDDNTWLYFILEKPVIPDSLNTDHWNPDIIHVNDVSLKDLPDEITLTLVDSIHGYCIPHPGPVRSTFKYRKKRPHKGVDISLTPSFGR